MVARDTEGAQVFSAKDTQEVIALIESQSLEPDWVLCGVNQESLPNALKLLPVGTRFPFFKKVQ